MRGSVKEIVCASAYRGQQRLRHGEAPDRNRGGLQQEFAAIHAPMAVLVVEIEHTLVDLGLGQRRR